MLKDLQSYLKDIDEMSKTSLNQDQKDLIKKILNQTDEKDLDNVFQLLIQRVKLGFTFDAAPSVDSTQVALLKKNEKLSFRGETINQNDNVLIIGENYDVLKNLIVIERLKDKSSTHCGGGGTNYFDVIYIDPPYNTEAAKGDGNNLSEKDEVKASKFIYRDKFSRTGWLNMMNERLRMARQLLAEEGVIFVSIDDTEQAYLKILMDEIFGEENFGATLSRITKKGGGRFGNSNLQKDIDYIHVYFKNFSKVFKFKKIKNDWDDYKYEDNRGKYTLKHPLDGGAGNPSYTFDVIYNGETFKPRKGKTWSFSKKRIDWLLKNDFISKNAKSILYVKNYKDFEIVQSDDKYSIVGKENGVDWSSSRLMENIYSNSYGKIDIEQIFKQSNFEYPKPVNLIKQLIACCPNKNARILDFFAGSGTTGHAVLELNREDGGNRIFTLVTNNENNIAKKVCYERLYRINNGIGTKKENDFDWIKKNKPYKQNLTVFDIEYYNTKIFESEASKVRKDFVQELIDFGIHDAEKWATQQPRDVLINLNTLKPIKVEGE
ncbi:LOW QUALITY PROTEIN: adenine-specific DNA-methyltransferase [Metamycoplasma subdolum]|uniref:Adenine-specific DNA-methyltransferase n=1 Tax=Metamycoplasma subdolum TaxID=92407 RepID=A0A3M0A301_9BACT|nr:LOW QUALITY PROTEIN: adenine-specific DNA-methyltransferase [Metamycoplasma subdolum]